MTDKGKAIEETNWWSRNFTEGVTEMIRNSPAAPAPTYMTEGDSSKGKRKFAELKYSPSTSAKDEEPEVPSAARSPVISGSSASSAAEVSEEEIKQRFCEVWRETKACIDALSEHIIDSPQISFVTDSFAELVYPDTYFIQPGHESYAVQAQLYTVFLRNFENESFGTSSAAAHQSDLELPPDPDKAKLRATRFYQYFKSDSESTDTDYVIWFEDRVQSFFETFRMYMASAVSVSTTVADAGAEGLLQILGGPDLLSHFRAAARACWRLQTLAFASEHPAERLTVNEGDLYDETRMGTVVDVGEDEFDGDRGDLTVSFMVAPGFYFKLGEPLVRAEVYLIGVAPELSSSPDPDLAPELSSSPDPEPEPDPDP